MGPVLYQVRRTPRGNAKLVYVDKLKPYYGPIPVIWGGDGTIEDHPREDAVESLEQLRVESDPEED